jgi:hypothetical protein
MSTVTDVGATSSGHGVPAWFTAERVALYSVIFLLIDATRTALFFWGAYVVDIPTVVAPGWDFAVFWSASWLTHHGGAAGAYNVALTEHLVTPLQHVTNRPYPTPWVYPPTFLLAVWFLALLPYFFSFAVFTMLGVAFCSWVYARAFRPSPLLWLPIIAFPPIWIAAIAGQTSFVTLGLGIAALSLLNRRPWAAGVCIGLLSIKPQLAVVFPLALLLGRQWRALVAAGMTAGSFCLVAGISLGFDTFGKFFRAAEGFSVLTATLADKWPGGIPTVFGLARHLGLTVPTAYLAQGAIAVLAIALVVYVFAIQSRYALRAAAIGIATMLVQPYLLGYDLIWLAVPLSYLAIDGIRHGWLKGDGAVLVCAWAAPVLYFIPFRCPIGQYLTFVLMAVAWLIFRRARAVTVAVIKR